MHTSTVTVAVIEELKEQQWSLREQDIEVFTTKDSGPGGQHRNKTESCVVMRHRPTGVEAKAASKSQHQNKRTARAVLEARVAELYRAQRTTELAALRKSQVGSGMRGDKVRTYCAQHNLAQDHRTGKKCRLSDVQDGALDKLR